MFKPGSKIGTAVGTKNVRRPKGYAPLPLGCGALWYDRGMKTAISLPDELFLSANELAKRQGVSRSELYATAVSEYLAKHRDEDVTAKLNEVFADEPSGLNPALRAAQARSVSSNKW